MSMRIKIVFSLVILFLAQESRATPDLENQSIVKINSLFNLSTYSFNASNYDDVNHFFEEEFLNRNRKFEKSFLRKKYLGLDSDYPIYQIARASCESLNTFDLHLVATNPFADIWLFTDDDNGGYINHGIFRYNDILATLYFPSIDVNIKGCRNTYIISKAISGGANIYFINSTVAERIKITRAGVVIFTSGTIFCLILLNILLIIYFRNKIYLISTTYTVLISVTNYMINHWAGSLLRFIAGGPNGMSEAFEIIPYVILFSHFIPVATLIYLLSFSENFIGKKTFKSLILRINALLKLVGIIFCCILPWHLQHLAWFTPTFSALVMIWSLFIYLPPAFNRNRRAIYFLVALSFMVAGNICLILSVENVTTRFGFLSLASMIGNAIAAFVIFCAVFDRTREKEKRQSDKINKLNTNLQQINKDLEQIVDDRTKDIKSIMSHVPIGIVLLSSDTLNIKNLYSSQMQILFKDFEMNGASIIKLFDEYFNLTIHEKFNMKSILSASIGQHSLNFEANASHLPSELESIDGRYFRITWSVIECDEMVVERIIVTIDDITLAKNLENKYKNSSEEMIIVEEILDNEDITISSFFHAMNRYSKQNMSIIESKDLSRTSLIFANLHTAKGISGSLGFKRLSESLHIAEQEISEICQNPNLDSINLFNEVHKNVMNIFDKYHSVYTKKIGKSLNPMLSIDLDIADAIARVLEESTINEKLLDIISIPMEKFCTDLLSDRFRLAKDLCKLAPKIHLVCEKHINRSTASFIQQIFTHLLRNSMDHGIEDEKTRITSGKPPVATLFLKAKVHDGLYTLEFWDDGAGLNLERLRNIAIAKSLLTQRSGVSDEFLANMIFDQGFSTANRVTDISGRGVGMGAVKSFLEEAGGKLYIVLGERNGDHISFKIKMEVPDQFSTGSFSAKTA